MRNTSRKWHDRRKDGPLAAACGGPWLQPLEPKQLKRQGASASLPATTWASGFHLGVTAPRSPGPETPSVFARKAADKLSVETREPKFFGRRRSAALSTTFSADIWERSKEKKRRHRRDRQDESGAMPTTWTSGFHSGFHFGHGNRSPRSEWSSHRDWSPRNKEWGSHKEWSAVSPRSPRSPRKDWSPRAKELPLPAVLVPERKPERHHSELPLPAVQERKPEKHQSEPRRSANQLGPELDRVPCVLPTPGNDAPGSSALCSAALLARGADWISGGGFQRWGAQQKPQRTSQKLQQQHQQQQQQNHLPPLTEEREKQQSGEAAARSAEEAKPVGEEEESSLTANEFRRIAATGGTVEDAMKVWDLAHQMGLPVETLMLGYEIFSKHAVRSESKGTLVEQGRLSRLLFTRVLAELSGKHAEDVPTAMIEGPFKSSGKKELSFSDFAQWLSTHSFSEELNLDQEQKSLREIARKHRIQLPTVDQYLQNFKVFDVDNSGVIDRDEFDHLLAACAKVPKDLGLPNSRVQQLWRTADTDGSGEIDFEEFLVFYMRYFDVKESQHVGFEDFYRKLRRIPGST